MIEYVEIPAAREASGVRIVVSGLVPSPWSEATKGLFRLAGIPVRAVRRERKNGPEVDAWTGVDNVPVVLHDGEPPRTNWAAIVALAARLAGPGVLLPRDLRERAEVVGLLEMIAGEDGLGWGSRLAMIDASLTSEGARGFPGPVAGYLAPRYGYRAEAIAESRLQVAAQLAILRDRLLVQHALGHRYLAGAAPSALDVYTATFLTPLSEIPPEACPDLTPRLRQAFASAHEQLGELVPAELAAHRTLMLEQHLGFPIAL